MKKPENLVKTILHGVMVVLGGLMLAFLALPFFVAKAAGMSQSVSGYDMMQFDTPNPSSAEAFSAISVLLVIIFACLLVVVAVLALLGDFGVISNETYAKVVKWALVVVAALAFIATVLSLIASVNFASWIVKRMGGKEALKAFGLTMTAGWANIILNLICGLGAAGAAAYTVVKKD